MNVLLIDIDSKFPNLALMKLSAYHKKKGDRVFLNAGCRPDKTYISCIFTKNGAQAKGIKTFYPDAVLGGTGVSLDVIMPDDIEHIHGVSTLRGDMRGNHRKGH